MKKGKVFAVAGVTLLAAGLLAACSGSSTSKSGSGSNEDKNYGYVYTSDPTTLDYTISSKAATHDITTNVVDGLLENDKYGNLVPSLAEDWSVSKERSDLYLQGFVKVSNGTMQMVKNMAK